MDLLLAHLLGLLLTAVVTAITAYWVRRQTDDRSATVMAAMLVTQSIFATLVAAQVLAPTLGMKQMVGRLWFSLFLMGPSILLVFAVSFTGREAWLTRPVRWTLLAFVGGAVALTLTEPLHGLLFLNAHIAAEPFPHLAVETTALAKVLAIGANLPVVVGLGLLFHMHLVSRRTTWSQTGSLLVGLLFIVVPALLSVTDFVPIRGFPYGVFGASIFGVIVSFGLFKRHLFGVVPLARGAAFSSLDDAILVVDGERRLVDFNEAAADLSPDLETHLGDPLDDVVPALVDTDRRATDGAGVVPMAAETAAKAETGPFASTVELTDESGTRTLRVQSSKIARGGEPRGYVLVLRDVTELERYAADLERKTEQLEQFASVLSHDLRNPLSVAHGHVALEAADGDSDHLETALSALDRIDETISDLLTLAKEDSAAVEIETVDLRAVVDAAWETSDTDAVTLTNDVDDSTTAAADRSRLQRLLENLFRNVADHGGDTVRVGLLSDGFFVEDNGPGIPPADRETVFEYGYSGDDGTGYGLAIVAAIAETHDWDLSITESESGGARVDCTGVEVQSTRAIQ
ncbi:histidine kinase N-terminal 7TM domain-containing protein [Haloarcula salina]|uniref:sensor histidine kinase n=1 Tax=Haloarcula salina TaxID=1429914 RepID=UPI003C6F73A1